MIAFIGQREGRHALFGLTHASVATAAVALARTDGDLVKCVDMLLDGVRSRRFKVDEYGVPYLPTRASFAVMADLDRGRLVFFACADQWQRVGELEPHFPLVDVESIESWLLMTLPPRPNLRAVGVA